MREVSLVISLEKIWTENNIQNNGWCIDDYFYEYIVIVIKAGV